MIATARIRRRPWSNQRVLYDNGFAEAGNHVFCFSEWLHVGHEVYDVTVLERVSCDVRVDSRAIHDDGPDASVGHGEAENKRQHFFSGSCCHIIQPPRTMV